MDIQFSVDDAWMAEMQKALGTNDPKEVVRESFTLLGWAVHDREKGRVILSADPGGQNVNRLAMASLDRVPKRP